jgi:hypothetical protein
MKDFKISVDSRLTTIEEKLWNIVESTMDDFKLSLDSRLKKTEHELADIVDAIKEQSQIRRIQIAINYLAARELRRVVSVERCLALEIPWSFLHRQRYYF